MRLFDILAVAAAQAPVTGGRPDLSSFPEFQDDSHPEEKKVRRHQQHEKAKEKIGPPIPNWSTKEEEKKSPHHHPGRRAEVIHGNDSPRIVFNTSNNNGGDSSTLVIGVAMVIVVFAIGYCWCCASPSTKHEFEVGPVFANRGLRTNFTETHIAAPVATVAEVLSDETRATEWVSSLLEQTVIEGTRTNGPTGQWEVYQRYHLYWPMCNRDYVMRYKWYQNENGNPTLLIHDFENSSYPSPKDADGNPSDRVGDDGCRYVRAAVHKIMYTLLEVKPTQTKVMVESCIDPSGGMPLGLANIYGGIWGGKQLRHLTHQCDKIVEERSK